MSAAEIRHADRVPASTVRPWTTLEHVGVCPFTTRKESSFSGAGAPHRILPCKSPEGRGPVPERREWPLRSAHAGLRDRAPAFAGETPWLKGIGTEQVQGDGQ